MEKSNLEEENKLFVELTAEVVSAYVINNVVSSGDLPILIADVHRTLADLNSGLPQQQTTSEKQLPAVPIKKSVHNDQIICLECGRRFKSLKRHLGSNHSLTAAEYRTKWNLSADYPMVAPDYAAARSRLARDIGLGNSQRRTKTKTA